MLYTCINIFNPSFSFFFLISPPNNNQKKKASSRCLGFLAGAPPQRRTCPTVTPGHCGHAALPASAHAGVRGPRRAARPPHSHPQDAAHLRGLLRPRGPSAKWTRRPRPLPPGRPAPAQRPARPTSASAPVTETGDGFYSCTFVC